MNRLSLIAQTSEGPSPATLVLALQDSQGPAMTVLAPRDGDVLPPGTFLALGTIEDAAGVEQLTLGDVRATLNGSRWSANLSLSPGEQKLNVIAQDILGNTTVQTLSIRVVEAGEAAQLPPYLVISEPLEGATVSRLTSVSGSAQNANGLASLTVNGAATALTSSTFTTQVYLTKDLGPDEIAVEAVDVLGQRSRTVRSVMVDDRAPSISLDSYPSRTNASTVEFTGSATIPNSRIVTQLASQTAETLAGADGRFSLTSPQLERGPNVLFLYGISPTGVQGGTVRADIEVVTQLFDLSSMAPAQPRGEPAARFSDCVEVQRGGPARDAQPWLGVHGPGRAM